MADSTVAALAAAGALDAGDLFYADDGAADVKVTAAQIKTWTSDSPTLVTPNLGTPSAGVLTNATGLPLAAVTGLAAGVATFLGTPSSANLITAVTDETGTGALVFANTPTLVTPVLGAAIGTSVTLSSFASLGTASSATGQLRLAHASSANLTTITAGNAAAAVTYVWPTNVGAAGTTLTDAAGNGTLSWAAGGGLPAGVSSPGTGQLAFATGAITTSQPSITVSQTWNDGGVTFKGLTMDITDTASAAASEFLNIGIASSASQRLIVKKGTSAKGPTLFFGDKILIRYDDGLDSVAFRNAADSANMRIDAPLVSVLSLYTSLEVLVNNGADVHIGSEGHLGTPTISIKNNGQVGWNSGVANNGSLIDVALKRAAAKVISFEAASSAGGTWRAVATSPAQIAANQDNYNPGGSSYFQRWNSDAARDVTGLTFTAAQVDGQQHVIVNVGAQNITLKEQVTSTAANQFMNSTAADIVLSPKQSAWVIYDGTTARWRVFKQN